MLYFFCSGSDKLLAQGNLMFPYYIGLLYEFMYAFRKASIKKLIHNSFHPLSHNLTFLNKVLRPKQPAIHQTHESITA